MPKTESPTISMPSKHELLWVNTGTTQSNAFGPAARDWLNSRARAIDGASSSVGTYDGCGRCAGGLLGRGLVFTRSHI